MRHISSHSRRPGLEWATAAQRVLSHWRHLDSEAEERLAQQAWGFDRAWRWEGLSGLEVTVGMRASVSTLAALLTVNIGPHVLADVTSVLVAPTSTTQATRHLIGGSIVGEAEACVLGSSLLHGPVRLSWDRMEADMKSRAGSVVLHEFAHKIDMADGSASGTPPISGYQQSVRFEHVLADALARVRRLRDPDPLSAYAGTNAAELFAVSTEAFFLRPGKLRAGYGDLFDALEGFYRQRPTVRDEPPPAGA